MQKCRPNLPTQFTKLLDDLVYQARLEAEAEVVEKFYGTFDAEASLLWGLPVYVDPSVPAGKIFVLNPQYMRP